MQTREVLKGCRYCGQDTNEALVKDADGYSEFHLSCHERMEEEYQEWEWEREQEFFAMLETEEIEFIQQESRT